MIDFLKLDQRLGRCPLLIRALLMICT